jgi:hypothetical protein
LLPIMASGILIGDRYLDIPLIAATVLSV